MPENNDERYYKISKLNKWFALSSLVFLAAMVGMFVDDYSSEWKKYQQQFRQLEIDKTNKLYDKEKSRLERKSKYRKVQAKLEQAKSTLADRADQLSEAETELKKLKAKDYQFNQEYQFIKAIYDATLYRYEVAESEHSHDLPKIKEELDDLAQQMEMAHVVAEDTNIKLKKQEEKVQHFSAEIRKIEREKKSLTKNLDLLESKLKKVDTNWMTFANRLGDKFRDLPLVDFMNPYYKIDQVVIRDVVDDLYFARVPRVDRCTTCHLGATKKGFENEAQPFQTHPNLELFLTSQSPHPQEEFGCTSCHAGRGRATSFYSTTHTPSTSAQAHEWKEKFDWHKMHYWQKPMFPTKYTEAGCFQCHSGETELEGADKLNLGLALIEKSGCYGCHAIEKFENKGKSGPALDRISSKLSKDWVYRWIKDPKSFRHTTRMPQFFAQTNSNSPETVKRNAQEIHAMTHLLFDRSSEVELDPIPDKGNIAQGEKLVASIGCLGCHTVSGEDLPEAKNPKEQLELLRRQQGPNLSGLGSKTSAKWIYNWIKNPTKYFPETRMPNLRLSDREASDITAYLMSFENNQFNQSQIPPIDNSELDDMVVEFLSKSMPENDAKVKATKMSSDEKLTYTGEKTIRHYGCFGCHNIPGFETDKPIGTELTEEGSKSVAKLDFGLIHNIEHVNYAWFDQKLKDPRIFDNHKVKAHYDKLKMPNFGFSDAEREAIVTALLGFVKPEVSPSKLKPRTPKNAFVEEGQGLISQYNCKGCHEIEGNGGAIQPATKDWLVKYEGMSASDAKASTNSFTPPNLIGEGSKVKTEWLHNFMEEPETIRPWLEVRMPTFDFSDRELNILTRYFSYLDDQDFPFVDEVEPSFANRSELEKAKTLLESDFQCLKCHLSGGKLPSGSKANWAPDLALAKDRLKPEWIIKWLKDPQRLLPGTKMPEFFDPENIGVEEEKQLKALRDYILTIE